MNAVLKATDIVDVADDYQAELSSAIQAEISAAIDHAQRFYSSGRRSMVASIGATELFGWDGTDEAALVSDSDGIDPTEEMLAHTTP